MLTKSNLDSLVNPGTDQSPHLHQVVGGNAFGAKMDKDIPTQATCTTCTFAEDFSNYWTAVLYFRARNGSFHRVSQSPNVGFEQAKGGMTIYYTPYVGSKSTVTAFKPVCCPPDTSTSHSQANMVDATSRDSACSPAILAIAQQPKPRTTGSSPSHVSRTP